MDNSFCLQPALHIHRLSFLLEKAADQALQQRTELTFSQCMILLSLQESPGCSQRSIARCRDLTQAAVSRQMDGLCKRGLVSRQDNKDNRREHVLMLTAKGKRQLDLGVSIITEKFEMFFGVLKPHELLALRAAIDSLLASVRGESPEMEAC